MLVSRTRKGVDEGVTSTHIWPSSAPSLSKAVVESRSAGFISFRSSAYWPETKLVYCISFQIRPNRRTSDLLSRSNEPLRAMFPHLSRGTPSTPPTSRVKLSLPASFPTSVQIQTLISLPADIFEPNQFGFCTRHSVVQDFVLLRINC